MLEQSIGAPTGAIPVQLQTDDLREIAKPRRNRQSAKKAGANFEGVVAEFLAFRLADDRIERRTKNGTKDRGDITGVKTIRGGRVVIEAKSYSSDRIEIKKWLNEAATEAANDDAPIGVVAVKVRGTAVPAEQMVCMTLETFARLIEGGPDEGWSL